MIISVSGRRTRTVAEYIEAKGLRPAGTEIVVFCAGATLALSLGCDLQSTPDLAKVVANLIDLRVGREDIGKGPTA